MRKVFQEELTQVGDQLVEISRLVSEAMDKATTSFQVADVDLAQDVIAADATTWGTSLVINPGVRWAHNLANGTQVVPGFSVPVDVKRPAGEKWSVFAYLSIEHPFGKHHE